MSTIRLLVALTFIFTLPCIAHEKLWAEDSPWTNKNRIAISADGNPDADADDVGKG